MSKVGMSYFIEDLNTRNGTYLNEVFLIPSEAMKIKVNDIIRIGDTLLQVISDESSAKKVKHTFQEFDAYTGSNISLEIDCSISRLQEKFSPGSKKTILSPEEELKEEIKNLDSLIASKANLEEKMKRRDTLKVKIKEIEDDIIKRSYDPEELRINYKMNKSEWTQINSQLSKLEIELRRLNTQKKLISTKMLQYEEYEKIATEKTRLVLELKNLSRESLIQQQSKITQQLDDKEILVRKLEKKVTKKLRDNEREKENEKHKIQEEIKRLQNKLEKSEKK